jgi:beta-glucosidase
VPDADAEIAAAAALAVECQVALVVVGTDERIESEGADRSTLALPGRQDDLVRAVAAANPRTVVVVNAGAPVLLPWRDEVAAVLLGWFGGEQCGAALADVLLGAREPGGRLPTTWAATGEEAAVLDGSPSTGGWSTTRASTSGTAAGCAPARPRPTRSGTAWATRPGRSARRA